jgi:hypothetical protein
MDEVERAIPVSAPEEMGAFLEPIAALQRLVSRFRGKAVIIGGIAVSLIASPRLTVDIDAMVLFPVEDLHAIVEAAIDEGIVPRISDAEGFARRSRVLLFVHQKSGIKIDVSLGELPFEIEAFERSSEFSIGKVSFRLPTPEDLVILKAIAHRPKDLLDIQALVDAHPDLDRDRIRFWVTQFAELLESPEIWSEVSSILEGKEQDQG